MSSRPLSYLLLLVLLSPPAACGKKESEPAAQPGAPAGQAGVQTYQVTGTVQQLPAPGAPERTVVIAHEEIPDFVNARGERTGMKAMTMPFPVAQDVSLDGVSVGDRVRFTLAVNWTGKPRFQITKLEKV